MHRAVGLAAPPEGAFGMDLDPPRASGFVPGSPAHAEWRNAHPPVPARYVRAGRRVMFRERGGFAVDPKHFDDLVKRLAQGSSRRNVLKGVAGGIAAVFAGGVARQSADAASKV